MTDKEENKSENTLAFFTDDKYTMNKELDDKYKKLLDPVGKRMKNCVVYNMCIVFAYYYFARNINYFRKKYQSGKDFSNMKIVRMTLLYTILPTLLLAPNIFILFGMHPIKYFKDKKELEEKLLGGKELKDSLSGFESMYKKDIATSYSTSNKII